MEMRLEEGYWVGRVWKKEGREWYNNRRMRRDTLVERE